MSNIPFAFVRDGQRHYIALVGGGGKTTLLYELAEDYARRGKRAVALTSTHIFAPARQELWVQSAEAVRRLWQQGRFAVLGSLEAATGKLVAPSKELYAFALAQADAVICEADGAKQKPIKVPRAQEPVLPQECDIVIGVAGLDALGRTWEEACFSWREAEAWLGLHARAQITAEQLARLLLADRGTRKGVGARAYYVVLNKTDRLHDKREAARLWRLLVQGGLDASRIWLRGKAKGDI